MSIMGDTVRLTGSYYNFANVLADPTTPTVQIYDSDKNELGAEVALDEDNHDGVGLYHYDYTIPDGYKKLYYEFKGILDGTPSVERGEIRVTWL